MKGFLVFLVFSLQGCAIMPSVSLQSTPYRDRVCVTVDEAKGSGGSKPHTMFVLRCIDLDKF